MFQSFERRLLFAAVLGWLVVAVLSIIVGPPLGHDEAAFAVAARGDSPAWVYRSAGVTEVARIGVLLGGAEWQLRIASALLGTLVVVGVYLVGRVAFSERVGAWAALVIAGAHPMALRSAELIGDLPATGCVLVGIAVIAGELSREDGPRWRLVVAGPAFAAAFYLRYASMPVIGMVGIAAAVLWWRAIRRRPLPVLCAVGVFAALILPHLVHSLRSTGSLSGILAVSANMPRRAFLGEGLVTYLTSNPFRYYGALVAPVVLLGLGGLVTRLVRRTVPLRPSLFLGAVALGQLVMLGLRSHAQPRYVFIAISVLVVLGVDTIMRHAPSATKRFALPAVALAWLGVAIAVPFHAQHIANLRAPIISAAEVVRTDANGAPCLVTAKVVTQLMWYTRCREQLVRALDALPPWPNDRRIYLVSTPSAFMTVEAVVDYQPATSEGLAVPDPRARVWRLTPVSPVSSAASLADPTPGL